METEEEEPKEEPLKELMKEVKPLPPPGGGGSRGGSALPRCGAVPVPPAARALREKRDIHVM